ncbi:MAG TPA: response regulator transcription factor [Solirubrobacteraceae bacterium]|nr:response regulator transcription factor [Solirubrobacteraceae bacterium]
MDTASPAPAGDGAITIVLADDHVVMRDGLKLLLEGQDDFAVVAEADAAADTVRAVEAAQPRVLILDMNLQGEMGLSILPEVQQRAPGTAVVVLTMQDDPLLARRALRAGVCGYVLKDAAADELVSAVRAAARRRTYLQPELGARMARLDDAPETDGGGDDALSAREVQVLRMIALGYTNREIAEELVLSVRTVESHRSHLHHKLRRTTRADLVRYALDHHLLD